jgi:hypothetical protein
LIFQRINSFLNFNYTNLIKNKMNKLEKDFKENILFVNSKKIKKYNLKNNLKIKKRKIFIYNVFSYKNYFYFYSKN